MSRLPPSRPLSIAALATTLIGAALVASVTPACAAGPANTANTTASMTATSGAPAATTTPTGVDWHDATSDADIAQAFATARAQDKPVLLYWGATWCPPCNQLKATLFNRQDFAERSKSFIAVHLDGDAPGAQKLGMHFKVVGYPTLILFRPDGKELTRLPGEVDAAQVMQVLQLGLASGRPIAQVLADASAGKPLPGNDWRLLAFYSWDTDESALLPAAERAPLLRRLSAACPASEAEACTRLLLKSMADPDEKNAPPPDANARERVLGLLADPAQSRAFMDVLTNAAPDLVLALAATPGAERQRLVTAMDAALARLAVDTTLSRADRLTALNARVDLARLDQPKSTLHPTLPPALVRQVRDATAQADREVTNAYERQSVIIEAEQVLGEAGLWSESDALLKSSLARSHAPYYLMSELGANAHRQGRDAEALQWYGKAWETSEGPATRLQWGASYLGALVMYAPQDSARIEEVAGKVIAEAATQPNAFYERSGHSLQRVGARLIQWNAAGAHQAAIDRLRTQLQAVCAKLPAGDPGRGTCDGVFKPAATKA